MEKFEVKPLGANEFFEMFDFGIYKTTNKEGEKCYKLKDWQGANLGDIESDEYVCLEGAVERLNNMYYDDYIIDPIKWYIEDKTNDKNYDKVYACIHHNRSYKDLLNALIELNDKELYGDMTYLYYIINPDKLTDDVMEGDE